MMFADSRFYQHLPGKTQKKEAQSAFEHLYVAASQEFSCNFFVRISQPPLHGDKPSIWGLSVTLHLLNLSIGQRRHLTYFTTGLWEETSGSSKKGFSQSWDSAMSTRHKKMPSPFVISCNSAYAPAKSVLAIFDSWGKWGSKGVKAFVMVQPGAVWVSKCSPSPINITWEFSLHPDLLSRKHRW